MILTESVWDFGVSDSVDDDGISDGFVTVGLVLLLDSAYAPWRREPMENKASLVHTLTCTII